MLLALFKSFLLCVLSLCFFLQLFFLPDLSQKSLSVHIAPNASLLSVFKLDAKVGQFLVSKVVENGKDLFLVNLLAADGCFDVQSKVSERVHERGELVLCVCRVIVCIPKIIVFDESHDSKDVKDVLGDLFDKRSLDLLIVEANVDRDKGSQRAQLEDCAWCVEVAA